MVEFLSQTMTKDSLQSPRTVEQIWRVIVVVVVVGERGLRKGGGGVEWWKFGKSFPEASPKARKQDHAR